MPKHKTTPPADKTGAGRPDRTEKDTSVSDPVPRSQEPPPLAAVLLVIDEQGSGQGRGLLRTRNGVGDGRVLLGAVRPSSPGLVGRGRCFMLRHSLTSVE